jgi:hypothetical protein
MLLKFGPDVDLLLRCNQCVITVSTLKFNEKLESKEKLEELESFESLSRLMELANPPSQLGTAKDYE